MSKRTDFLSKKGMKSITTTTEGVSHTTSPCLPKRGATERRGLLKKIPLTYIQVIKHVPAVVPSCNFTNFRFNPWAAVLMCIYEHFQVTS